MNDVSHSVLTNRKLKILFWFLTALGSSVIVWKFIGSQDQPMENKILYVFGTFLAGAGLFRLIRKKSSDEGLNLWAQEAIEWSDTGISAVLLAFVIMSFVVQAFKIPSSSMVPTLQIGDHLFVNKFIYGTHLPFTMKRLWKFKDVKRFDVVVFLCPPAALSEEDKLEHVQKDFIKRAIGLPGDMIQIKDKALYINGELAVDAHAYFMHAVTYPKAELWPEDGSYQKSWQAGEFTRMPVDAVRDNFGPIKVPDHTYFVMGDNRDGSFDSRFWGPLPENYLKGRAWRVYWPFSRFQTIH